MRRQECFLSVRLPTLTHPYLMSPVPLTPKWTHSAWNLSDAWTLCSAAVVLLTLTGRHAGWWTVNRLDPVSSNRTYAAYKFAARHEKWALPPASWLKSFLRSLMLMSICDSFTYSDCIDYCPGFCAPPSITASVRSRKEALSQSSLFHLIMNSLDVFYSLVTEHIFKSARNADQCCTL